MSSTGITIKTRGNLTTSLVTKLQELEPTKSWGLVDSTKPQIRLKSTTGCSKIGEIVNRFGLFTPKGSIEVAINDLNNIGNLVVERLVEHILDIKHLLTDGAIFNDISIDIGDIVKLFETDGEKIEVNFQFWFAPIDGYDVDMVDMAYSLESNGSESKSQTALWLDIRQHTSEYKNLDNINFTCYDNIVDKPVKKIKVIRNYDTSLFDSGDTNTINQFNIDVYNTLLQLNYSIEYDVYGYVCIPYNNMYRIYFLYSEVN